MLFSDSYWLASGSERRFHKRRYEKGYCHLAKKAGDHNTIMILCPPNQTTHISFVFLQAKGFLGTELHQTKNWMR